MFSYYAFPPRVKQCLANTVLLTKRLHREPALLMLRNQLLPIFQSTDRCFAAHLSNIRFLAPFRHWGLPAAYHQVMGRIAMSEKIKPHHLERKAILYVRQSSAYQVAHNLESQKLQYAMERP